MKVIDTGGMNRTPGVQSRIVTDKRLDRNREKGDTKKKVT